MKEQRLEWAEGNTIHELLEDMVDGIKTGEKIIFYSITSNVIGYTPFYVAIVTYERER